MGSDYQRELGAGKAQATQLVFVPSVDRDTQSQLTGSFGLTGRFACSVHASAARRHSPGHKGCCGILALNGQPTPSADAMEAVLETANLKLTAEVWDARKSTLSGSLARTPPQPLPRSSCKRLRSNKAD